MTDSVDSLPQAASAPVPTERFERVLAFASDEADGLGHGYVTCQHILYALSRESKGLASAALEKLGVSADILHGLLAESAALHDRTALAQIDLADEVSGAIGRAVGAAREWGHRRLDTEHLLYGVLSAPSSADEMLATLRLEAGELMKALASMQQAAPTITVREEATHAHRFTLESAWLLSLATDLARRVGCHRVSSLHLLAALMSLAGPAQGLLVDSMGLSLDNVSGRIKTSADGLTVAGRVKLDDNVQRILGYAIGEAWNRGHLAVSPLHIAMGLARAERNPALDLLADLGVPQSRLVDELGRLMPPPIA